MYVMVHGYMISDSHKTRDTRYAIGAKSYSNFRVRHFHPRTKEGKASNRCIGRHI